MSRRTLDRAQRIRLRRIWWERHGAFARGVVAGAALAFAAAWALTALHIIP